MRRVEAAEEQLRDARATPAHELPCLNVPERRHALRLAHEAGVPAADLARILGVSRQRVHALLREPE